MKRNQENTTAAALRRSLIREAAGVLPNGCHRHDEHDLQTCCMTWLRYQHPQLDRVTFAVPNGGRRDVATAGKLRAEGVKAGVSDIIMLLRTEHYGALCIEMKTDVGRQSPAQRQWQRDVEEAGMKYVVCRSLDDFKAAVEEYVADKTQEKNHKPNT